VEPDGTGVESLIDEPVRFVNHRPWLRTNMVGMDQAYADDLIRRVAAKAAAEQSPVRPQVSESDLAQAEESLGFRLHPLLRRLYAEVADGGFGPVGYTLYPLATAVLRTTAMAPRIPVDLRDGERLYWPYEAVAIMDWGCAMDAVVDCRSADGAVLLVDPNPGLPDRAEEWFLDSESLAGWLESWLDGTGWYYEEDPDEMAELQPWPQAVVRLTERGAE
jgi:hypothetical protein